MNAAETIAPKIKALVEESASIAWDDERQDGIIDSMWAVCLAAGLDDDRTPDTPGEFLAVFNDGSSIEVRIDGEVIVCTPEITDLTLP